MRFFIFNGMFLLGFTGRFIAAAVILNILYAKTRSDKSLKRGLVILYTAGACIMVVTVFFMVMFLTFGGLTGFFSNIFYGFSNLFF